MHVYDSKNKVDNPSLSPCLSRFIYIYNTHIRIYILLYIHIIYIIYIYNYIHTHYIHIIIYILYAPFAEGNICKCVLSGRNVAIFLAASPAGELLFLPNSFHRGEMAVPVWAREKERSRDNRPLARRYGLWSSMLPPRMGMGWTRKASIFSQNPALQEQGWGTQGSSRLMPLESLGRRKVTLLVSKKSRTTSWRWSPKELGSWPHWVLFTQSSTSVPS